MPHSLWPKARHRATVIPEQRHLRVHLRLQGSTNTSTNPLPAPNPAEAPGGTPHPAEPPALALPEGWGEFGLFNTHFTAQELWPYQSIVKTEQQVTWNTNTHKSFCLQSTLSVLQQNTEGSVRKVEAGPAVNWEQVELHWLKGNQHH